MAPIQAASLMSEGIRISNCSMHGCELPTLFFFCNELPIQSRGRPHRVVSGVPHQVDSFWFDFACKCKTPDGQTDSLNVVKYCGVVEELVA